MSDEPMKKRAQGAARRTTIDAMMCLKSILSDVKVSPGANDLTNNSIPAADRVLLRVPDLLDLAVYAWYQLQEAQPNDH